MLLYIYLLFLPFSSVQVTEVDSVNVDDCDYAAVFEGYRRSLLEKDIKAHQEYFNFPFYDPELWVSLGQQRDSTVKKNIEFGKKDLNLYFDSLYNDDYKAALLLVDVYELFDGKGGGLNRFLITENDTMKTDAQMITFIDDSNVLTIGFHYYYNIRGVTSTAGFVHKFALANCQMKLVNVKFGGAYK